jgi:hypothetical protein
MYLTGEVICTAWLPQLTFTNSFTVPGLSMYVLLSVKIIVVSLQKALNYLSNEILCSSSKCTSYLGTFWCIRTCSQYLPTQLVDDLP